jgi:hypothetical protein
MRPIASRRLPANAEVVAAASTPLNTESVANAKDVRSGATQDILQAHSPFRVGTLFVPIVVRTARHYPIAVVLFSLVCSVGLCRNFFRFLNPKRRHHDAGTFPQY